MRSAPIFHVHVLLGLTVLGLGGCGSLSSGDNPFAGAGTRGAGSVVVEVQNLNFEDATLHAVASSSRHRMGSVTGKTRDVFEVPCEGHRGLRIEIDLLAGPSHTTRAVSVGPGDRIRLVIQPDLRRSYVER